MVPVLTPFGRMRVVPSWQKGDACDMVLFFTALCTATNIMPEIGLVLLLVDVTTDVLDLLAHMAISFLVQGEWAINEIMAKKFSLLGVMVLVAIRKWKEEHAKARATAAIKANGSLPTDGDAELQVPAMAMLVGRLLIACLFFHVAHYELLRITFMSYMNVDPNDPHNVRNARPVGRFAQPTPLPVSTWLVPHICALAPNAAGRVAEVGRAVPDDPVCPRLPHHAGRAPSRREPRPRVAQLLVLVPRARPRAKAACARAFHRQHRSGGRASAHPGGGRRQVHCRRPAQEALVE